MNEYIDKLFNRGIDDFKDGDTFGVDKSLKFERNHELDKPERETYILISQEQFNNMLDTIYKLTKQLEDKNNK